jgi:hypothetical protein
MNSDTYRRRAAVWRQRAAALDSNDATRDMWLTIAADYDSLAQKMEARERLVGREGLTHG